MRALVIFTILVCAGLGGGYYYTKHLSAPPESGAENSAPPPDPPSAAPGAPSHPPEVPPSARPEVPEPITPSPEHARTPRTPHRQPVPEIDPRVKERVDELTGLDWTVAKRIEWVEEQINARRTKNVRDDQ